MADFVVAVDGPAGSGKSSVCKEVARRLGFSYLDTGAGYRAFTLHVLRNPDRPLAELIASYDYAISMDPDNLWVRLGRTDITSEIRSDEVAGAVSNYAKLPEVRALQHGDSRSRIAASQPGVVAEGRDITTVVAPEADVRVLLTASEEVRMRRRGLDGGEDPSNVAARDASDSKVSEFMTPADGVALIDTTDLDFEQSVSALLDLIAKARHG